MTEQYYKPVGAGDGMGTVVVDADGMRAELTAARARIAELEAVLADMAVSPWREIDDEARNGEPWLVATKMEPSGKWVRQLAHYIPRYTEQNDEDFAERCEENDEYYTPEGWYEMCYEHDEYIAMGMKEAPSLYAPIPELPK